MGIDCCKLKKPVSDEFEVRTNDQDPYSQESVMNLFT